MRDFFGTKLASVNKLRLSWFNQKDNKGPFGLGVFIEIWFLKIASRSVFYNV